MRELEQLLGRERGDIKRIASFAGRFYHQLDMSTTKPGRVLKWRHLDVSEGELRSMQRRIQTRILRPLTFPPTMLGAIPGRSIRLNAAVHLRQPLVVTLDIKNFFPTSRFDVVYRRFCEELQCSPDIAHLLTQLTTFRRRIPQGAPTSSAVANLVALPLHDALQRIALERGLCCTIWVDDIAISGDGVLDGIEDVIEAIHRFGYAIARKKLKIQGASNSQSVTGVVVNDKPSAGRNRLAAIRAEIHVLANGAVVPSWQLERVQGLIGAVEQVCGSQARPLRRLAEQLNDRAVTIASRPRSGEWLECQGGRHCRARTLRA